ncbi:hypothetical protein HNY73_019583 [Argiope bruennichi]|uniref:Uncharacterized protein n=1 Tax=Argiope bruennichi TaxID=94029 RepID=A0A8T0E5C2_ARGBR|nr:hypothetical protein HNY73_019583 [Argiope bruennichi]
MAGGPDCPLARQNPTCCQCNGCPSLEFLLESLMDDACLRVLPCVHDGALRSYDNVPTSPDKVWQPADCTSDHSSMPGSFHLRLVAQARAIQIPA